VTRYHVRYPPKGTQPFVMGATAMLIHLVRSLASGICAAGTTFMSSRRRSAVTSP
jgi:hypothetical protein